MKSQVIKVKNLKSWAMAPKAIRLKPITTLVVIAIGGACLLFSNTYLAGLGVCLMTVSLFSLLLLPDRKLVEFTPDYLIMYNQRDESMCTIIYWDEIVKWRYEWHATYDYLVVTLIDGSSERIEMYSKHSIARSMEYYAPNKEIKNVRVKEENES